MIVLRLCLLLLLLVASGSTFADDKKSDSHPNFLVIITDDQRYGTVSQYMPHTQARIFDEGLTFTNGYVTTPSCCPSRSSIFTGMYASRHGVHQNRIPLRKKTFSAYLHEWGYYTGLVGKYLNSWDGSARPEFDYWVSFKGGSSAYNNPRLNVNGTWERKQGYITHLFRDYATEFLKKASAQGKPFSLIVAFNAPHRPTTPAEDTKKLYKDLAPHRPLSFAEADRSDKPRYIKNRPSLSAKRIEHLDRLRQRELQTLWSVDEAIDSLLNALKEQKQLDQTVIFFLSDNGVLWGEHGLISKDCVYEEAIHVPFALRYPKLVPKPLTEKRLVANIDIAPTIYDLIGRLPAEQMDGMSITHLLNNKQSWRTELLFEGWLENGVRKGYSAVHTERYVYVENDGDRNELYDLESDPLQLTNLADDHAKSAIIADMKERLQHLQPKGVAAVE